MRKLVFALVISAAVGSTGAAAVAGNSHFKTHATADQEVQTPAVETNAQGQAQFRLSDDGTQLAFKLNVANLEDVLFAHLHLAPEGVNGDIVAFLFDGPTVTGRVGGRLAQGVLTASDLIGPLAGQPLSVLIEQIRAGNVYVNVHTEEFPMGEVRGQVR
jgi:hypothetical protein